MKDVKKAFRVLKQNCHVVKHVAHLWDDQRITIVLYACIIMHNMMVEAKGRTICKYMMRRIRLCQSNILFPHLSDFLAIVIQILSVNMCKLLREDSTTHIYENNRNNEN